MDEKLRKLVRTIEDAQNAPITKKAKLAEKAAKTAASLSADLVRGYNDLSDRVARLEAEQRGA